VSRAVLCLRLSTWIALVEYRRNPMIGFSMASRYTRNQPLTFVEACLQCQLALCHIRRSLPVALTWHDMLAPFSITPQEVSISAHHVTDSPLLCHILPSYAKIACEILSH